MQTLTTHSRHVQQFPTGLVLRYRHLINDNHVAHIPFTLFPSPFPKSLYKECLEIQPSVNTLMTKIANDIDFIEETLSPIAQVDDFTRNLLKLNKIVQKEGLAQPIISCIIRADYMLDKYVCDSQNKLRIRQVEMNAIASSMSAHSHNTHSLHKYLRSKYKLSDPEQANVMYPENQSLALVAQGLIEAFNLYKNGQAHVLVVTEERSLNFSDQLLVELEVHKIRPDIRFVRRRFVDLPELITLGPNKELILGDSKEIGVVYYRYGYDPTNYNFREAWDVRLTLERSRAIKCPSINYHLSGAKKFQQVLHDQKQLERFVDHYDAKRLSKASCKFWPVDAATSEGEEGFRVGLGSSKSLVLKPQREGGGHNIFNQDIRPFLESIADSEERSQYILMEYIDSPLERNWLLLQDDIEDVKRLTTSDQLVSELGIFGSVIADGSNIISNEAAGYLIRSKKYGVNEGGVASGYAGISSLILYDDDGSQLTASSNASEFYQI